jgi:hypothetical protein
MASEEHSHEVTLARDDTWNEKYGSIQVRLLKWGSLTEGEGSVQLTSLY